MTALDVLSAPAEYPKNFVTSFELRYVPANRFNLARHINAGPAL